MVLKVRRDVTFGEVYSTGGTWDSRLCIWSNSLYIAGDSIIYY